MVRVRVIAVVAALFVGLGLVALYVCSSADTTSPVSADPSAHPFKPVRHGPDFSQPEDAKRYLDEVIQADRRELAKIEAALKNARARPNPDQLRIGELEHERATRAARIGYHAAARDQLGD